MTKKSLGTLIREAREKQDMSQRELAKFVGISHTAIGDWENDRIKKIDLLKLGSIIVTLDMPVLPTLNAAGYKDKSGLFSKETGKLRASEWDDYIDQHDDGDLIYVDDDGHLNVDKMNREIAKDARKCLMNVIDDLKKENIDKDKINNVIEELFDIYNKLEALTIRVNLTKREADILAGKNIEKGQ